MRTFLALVTTCVALTTAAVTAADGPRARSEKTMPLHSCDSTEGISTTYGTTCSQKRISLNTDGAFISQGEASLHLAGKSQKDPKGNCYLGMMIPLDHADVANRCMIFDCWTSTPATTQAIYLRLYGPKGRKVASWSNWNRPFAKSPRIEVRLDLGGGRGGFGWEAKNSDLGGAADVVMAEIIIGTRDSDAGFEVYVDNLRMSEARRVPFANVTEAKRLYIETPLVRAGRSEAVIVSPPGDRYGALAKEIQAKISQLCSVELPILDADTTTPAQLSGSHAILLGNVADNPAIVPLYAHLYTPVDADYPPEEGYLVHSVHDPWGSGKNVVVIGASTATGAAKATEAFLKTLKPGSDLILPKLNIFDLGDDEMKQFEERAQTLTDDLIAREVERAQNDFARGAHRAVAGRMGRYGVEYSKSGNPMLAKLYKLTALAWYESYQQKPDIYGGPWGMDMDFHLMEILPAWDSLEESPLLSDEDRLAVSKVLHEFVTTDVVRKASGTLSSTHVRHNHATFPALGLYFAGRYFSHGYNPPEAEYWLEIAQACFGRQALAAKPYEDCNGYGWLVPYHTMRYALATGDSTYFDTGNVRFQADYAILTMDNLGYQVPYGDTGSYQCWWSEIPFLRGAEFHHRNGRYAWALEKKFTVRRDSAHYRYAAKSEPVEPVDLLGARAIPLDRSYWESFKGPETIPLEKTVDKVVMRATFDPAREYLLLDGLSNGGHRHEDGNSISRITDRNRIWLADNDYIRSLPKFHNSILVFQDGQAEPMPPYCELETVADGARYGVSQTVVRDYASVDWHRAILWNKGKFFLVVDELVAGEAADYDFHCFWHTVGEARLTGEGLEVTQKGPKFFVKRSPSARLKLTDDFDLGKNWNGYAHADPVVRSLRQIQSARLDKGDRVVFANLLFAADDERPEEFSVAGIDQRAFVVHSEEEATLAGVGDPDSPRQVLPGLRVAALTFQLDETSALVADCRQLAWADLSLQSETPVTMELSEGTIKITAKTPTTLQVACGEKKPSFTGKASQAVLKEGRWSVDLDVGTSEIEVADGFGLTGLKDALRAALKKVAKPATVAQADQAAPDSPVGKVVWSVGPGGKTIEPTAKHAPSDSSATYLAIAAGDLDADGVDEIVAGSDDKNVYCFTTDGRLRWKFPTGGRVTTTAVANLDGSGPRYAAAGSEDCNVYALTPSGEKKWSFQLPQYKRPGRVRVLMAADLDADGRDEIIAGGDNWRYHALDRDGNQLWRYESVHPSSAGAAADLDGDGKLEVLCGTVYYWWHCAASDGTGRWRYSVKGPHATVALSANFEGKHRRAAIFGAEDGTLHVLDCDGKLLWTRSVGDTVTGAMALDLNGDGREEIVAASLSFNLVALDATGNRVWLKNLGDSILALIAADTNGDGRPELVAGCEDGRICIVDQTGQIAGQFHAGSAVTKLAAATLKPNQKNAHPRHHPRRTPRRRPVVIPQGILIVARTAPRRHPERGLIHPLKFLSCQAGVRAAVIHG